MHQNVNKYDQLINNNMSCHFLTKGLELKFEKCERSAVPWLKSTVCMADTSTSARLRTLRAFPDI